MPVVPITSTKPKAKGKTAMGPAPEESWALMAAAQMHAEGRLIPKETELDADTKEGWKNSWSDAMPDTPANRAKIDPTTHEGMTSESGMLFVRPIKKPSPAQTDLVS